MPAASGSDARRERCFPKASHTLAETTTARAYRAYDKRRQIGFVWACLFRVGRRVRLTDLAADIANDRHVTPVLLAGPYVGFQDYYVDHYGYGYDRVETVDLRSGRVVHRDTEDDGDPYYGHTRVLTLKMTPRGSLAWTQKVVTSPASGAYTVSYQVWKDDSSRRAECLDPGPKVDSRSLEVRGHEMTWRDGQASESAPIR